jgi:hypothetical protein
MEAQRQKPLDWPGPLIGDAAPGNWDIAPNSSGSKSPRRSGALIEVAWPGLDGWYDHASSVSDVDPSVADRVLVEKVSPDYSWGNLMQSW